MRGKKADVFGMPIEKLIELVLGVIAVVAIIAGIVLFYNRLYGGKRLTQGEVTFKILKEELEDLKPGEKFSIATFGNQEKITAYGGESAKIICPGKTNYCICIISGEDNKQCNEFVPVAPAGQKVKITAPAAGIPLNQPTITLEYRSGEITLS